MKIAIFITLKMRFFSIYIFEIVRASGNQTINCSDGSNGGCSHNCNWESVKKEAAFNSSTNKTH